MANDCSLVYICFLWESLAKKNPLFINNSEHFYFWMIMIDNLSASQSSRLSLKNGHAFDCLHLHFMYTKVSLDRFTPYKPCNTPYTLMSQISHYQTLMQSWSLTRDHWLVGGFFQSCLNISIFDDVVLLLCVVSRMAAFGDVAARDMINIAVVLCVHACMSKEVLVLWLRWWMSWNFKWVVHSLNKSLFWTLVVILC